MLGSTVVRPILQTTRLSLVVYNRLHDNGKQEKVPIEQILYINTEMSKKEKITCINDKHMD